MADVETLRGLVTLEGAWLEGEPCLVARTLEPLACHLTCRNMQTDADGEPRETLLAAFAREGISYPASRLDEAVADFADLVTKMALIRAACPSKAEPAQCFALRASGPRRDG